MIHFHIRQIEQEQPASIAQWLEHRSYKPEVSGSSPDGCTNKRLDRYRQPVIEYM